MKKKLFVDMDGTLARWEDGTPFEIVCQPEYSVRLPQNGNVVTALRSLFEHHQDDFDIFVLSSVLDLPHAIPDKEKWLDMYCEYIDSYHRLFVPYGMSKGKFLTYSHSSRNGILPLHCEIVLQRNRWLTQSYVPPQWAMPCPHEIY